jgi:hypothetical protein
MGRRGTITGKDYIMNMKFPSSIEVLKGNLGVEA